MGFKPTGEQLIQQLEEERDSLRRELVGVQEMLAFVLNEVGTPVVVSKQTLQKGLPDGTKIAVDDDIAQDAFVFRLVEGE